MSSRGVSLPVSQVRVFACSGQWAQVSRGSVNLVSALVKGEGYSPAHEGIRRVGAPSTQRPCSSGQANIRAHPPVEPARDDQAHPTIIIAVQWQSVSPSPVRWCSRVKRGDGGWKGRGAAVHIDRSVPEERIDLAIPPMHVDCTSMPIWSMAGLSLSAALTARWFCGAVYATTSSERPAASSHLRSHPSFSARSS